ncbi:Glutaryl-CoA dehydrogenase, mitochondrial [Trachymyrmex cornetzi]|uniref:Glutaryl-CoA dehydrogenase, mitochondrial n=1 Tax=Trachymyrmex cornetzi TaxID=471704 RepID=A0A151ITU2_9HYME|nr:Glutaryl-CoA dehydrogenase, mitochondrial [Trachymyrmex cornetzi]
MLLAKELKDVLVEPLKISKYPIRSLMCKDVFVARQMSGVDSPGNMKDSNKGKLFDACLDENNEDYEKRITTELLDKTNAFTYQNRHEREKISLSRNYQSTIYPNKLIKPNFINVRQRCSKERFLPKMVSGEKIGCFGLTEPNHGSDAGAMETRAIYDSDKKVYKLNGSKTWKRVTNSPVADVLIVWAKCDDGQIRGFVIEREDAGDRLSTPKIEGNIKNEVNNYKKLDDRINYDYIPRSLGYLIIEWILEIEKKGRLMIGDFRGENGSEDEEGEVRRGALSLRKNLRERRDEEKEDSRLDDRDYWLHYCDLSYR